MKKEPKFKWPHELPEVKKKNRRPDKPPIGNLVKNAMVSVLLDIAQELLG